MGHVEEYETVHSPNLGEVIEASDPKVSGRKAKTTLVVDAEEPEQDAQKRGKGFHPCILKCPPFDTIEELLAHLPTGRRR